MNRNSWAPLAFDISWIFSLAILILLPFVIPSFSAHPFCFLGVSCLIGVAMFFSNRLRGVSLVGKVLYWVALNIMKPRTKYNHLIWGSFVFVIGILGTIAGGQPNQEQIEFFQQIQKSHEYWIGITVVLLFNLLVGIYTAKKHRGD
jgi:hypothetical protein